MTAPVPPNRATNLLDLPQTLSAADGEFFETLARVQGDARIERIVSHGHTSPEGFWYDQDEDEWVLILQGEARIGFPDGREIELKTGGCLLLPRHVRHRVAYTSTPCVWLAVFAGAFDG